MVPDRYPLKSRAGSRPRPDPARLAAASFVIENATEKVAVKEGIYRELDKVCAEHCIFAPNTSAIPITRLAAFTSRADRFVGLHFMNPVQLVHTVEVVPGQHTSDETLAAARTFLKRMGKQMILVKDAPGFVSNRVMMPMINEAIWLVHEGVASPADVDRIFVTCYGHTAGPLHTADLIGLDTILNSLEVLRDHLQDDKFRPCPLLQTMVRDGHCGRKSGRGFFDYGGAS